MHGPVPISREAKTMLEQPALNIGIALVNGVGHTSALKD